MKRILTAFVFVAAAFIGGPAIAQGETVSFCHVPPGNPSNAKFHEDMPLESWENGHKSGTDNHGLDFLTDSESECLNFEGPGGGGDDDDDDDEDKDKDDKDKEGKLASTGA